MYERMLDKSREPGLDEFIAHCGQAGGLFTELDAYLQNELKTQRLPRFPYGNSYGWGMKYFIRKKHVCDLFAEREAVNLMIRLSNERLDAVYGELSDYTRRCADNKYPCGDGGWLHLRLLTHEHLEDAKKLLAYKMR